jgi:hypothetical protein
MQPFTLKCHPPGAAAPPAAFFILSRGRHTGRPAYTPNPNCFVFICAPQDLTGYYWLVYTLWQTRRFQSILRGTCIEFARIAEVRQLIAENSLHLEHIDKVVSNLQKLQALENKIKKQLGLIQVARRSLLKAG